MCSDVLTRAKSVALNVTDPSLLSGMFIDTRRCANSSVSCTLRSFAVHMSSPQQRLLHLLVSKSDCLFCYWHYPHSTGAGSMYLCTVYARLSVCPSVCPIRPGHSAARVCCCGPGKQKISIDCCPALSSSRAGARRAAAIAGSATLSADAGS